MISRSYTADNRLDIVLLGPMNNDIKEDFISQRIRQALLSILMQTPAADILKEKNITDYQIHIPEDWSDAAIVKGVLSRLDIADLVIFNLSPLNGIPSPNVYYELGLVHALGIPYFLLCLKEDNLPFYMRNLRSYALPEFSVDAIERELRQPLITFLRDDGSADFADNHVTQFYEGLPILDISAAVGLATSYYHNFVGRLLKEGSFLTAYPEKVKRVIIVRPQHILDTYEQDMEQLRNTLTEAGYDLGTDKKLAAPPVDAKGPVWIYEINGIVIDLPRAIYPLKISPRLLSMQDRMDKPGRTMNTKLNDSLLLQMSERMLDRTEQAIRYHVNRDRHQIRKNILHFSRIADLPALLQELEV